MKTLLRNGKVVTLSGSFDADVLIDGEKIAVIGRQLSQTGVDEVVDASGKYILPGIIDPHTPIAMPFMGTSAQDDYATGTVAAACGGVTWSRISEVTTC